MLHNGNHSLLLSWAPVVRDSEWVTVALHTAFRISVKWLQPCLVVRRPCHKKLLLPRCKFCALHNYAPVCSVTLCEATSTGGACVFSSNCQLHFWQNDRSILATWGWNEYQNRSQHRKPTLEKKILPLFLPGLKPKTLQSWVHHSTIELSIPTLPLLLTKNIQNDFMKIKRGCRKLCPLSFLWTNNEKSGNHVF